jgi:hypothetical protein
MKIAFRAQPTLWGNRRLLAQTRRSMMVSRRLVGIFPLRRRELDPSRAQRQQRSCDTASLARAG